MYPLMEFISDKKEHSFREIVEHLAKKFKLTEDERKELLSSGQQPLFDNRVGWSRTYLKKAGLLDSPRRTIILITEKGLNIVKQKPERINVKFLNQFPEFVDFHTLKKDNTVTVKIDSGIEQTPEEALDISYQNLRRNLAQEILIKVKSCSPAFFEKLVVELLVKMGYVGSIKDAGKAIGKSGDEGIDGIIKEDKLGLDVIYIQAKRWENVVGGPEIQSFNGALDGQGGNKGVFITTSYFSTSAYEHVKKARKKIILIDGEQLAQYMIDYNLGTSTIANYEIKKVDSDYFGEE